MSPTSGARPRDGRTLSALGLVAGIAVPAALLGGPQATALPAPPLPASSAAGEQPACGDPGAKEFPVEARIQNAPDRYASGGGYGTWFLEVTNTTDASCGALHPVLVLTDRDRRLTAEQIQLSYAEPGRPGAEHGVTWETTDRDEQIGVLGGLTVPAGKTVAVRVRMAFTSDTAPGPVSARAAVVQRHHQDMDKGGGRDDGDWVGESADYAFVIVDGVTGDTREPERPDPPRTDPGTGTTTERPEGPREEAGTGRKPLPERDSGTARPETEGDDESTRPPGLPPRDGSNRPLPELARTGAVSLAWTGAAAGALLLGGAALLAQARRSRRPAD
ncbi:peptidase [Streptomyces sp. NPDC049916]|uniref:peptidase n=1 Tax=Streptomyces sp. NPDC049916 TaxID=3155156 RepID=UPI0034423A1A